MEELRECDGTKNNQIYVGVKGNWPLIQLCLTSVKGKIYDVSSRGEFYGPGGPYHCFAGRDASRALALGSLEEKDVLNSSLDGLNATELEALEEWIQSYDMKYDVVGFYPFGTISESAGPADTSAPNPEPDQGEKQEAEH